MSLYFLRVTDIYLHIWRPMMLRKMYVVTSWNDLRWTYTSLSLFTGALTPVPPRRPSSSYDPVSSSQPLTQTYGLLPIDQIGHLYFLTV